MPVENEEETGEKLLTPKQLQEYIRAAEKWQKTGPYKSEDARFKQWERNKKYLMCVWPDSEPDDVPVNTIFANYQTVKPTLYFKNPKISVKAAKPSFTRDDFGNVVMGADGQPRMADNYTASRLFGSKLNYELKEIKFKKTLKKVLGDSLCPYGIGWAKVGYSKITVGGTNNDRDTKFSYWISRCDPRNIVYDWMSTDNDKSVFTAERLVMTRDDAEEYGILVPENYVCELPDFLKDRSDSATKGRTTSNLVIAWEFHHHVKKSTYYVLASGKEGFYPDYAKEPEFDSYPFEGSCYVPLVLNEDNDDIIGLSDVEPVEPQAKAINRIRTKQVKHIEWFGTHVDYEDGAITPQELKKTEKTDHGIYTKIATGKWGKFQRSSPPSMGQDHYQMDQVHKEDMRLTLGVTDYQQGGAQSRTATEGTYIQNAANIRIEERRDIIYDFVIECVRRLAALIQEFSTEEEYLNLADEDLNEDFVEVLKRDYGFNPKIPFIKMSRKDIQGEFNFEFNIEDMIVRPKEVQLQQWINLLGVVGSNPLLMKAAEEEDVSMGKVLNKIFDLAGADINEVKRGGPTPMTVEQENQMFIDGMEVPEPHRRDHDDEHILGHDRVLKQVEGGLMDGQAKAQETMDRAMKVQEMADPNDPNQAALAQQAEARAQMELQDIQAQMEPIQNIARKIKLHLQMHEVNRQKKEMRGLSGIGGMQGMNQAVPQGAGAQQVDLQAQARQI